MKRILLSAFLIAATQCVVMAQKKNVVLHYDFKKVENGVVKDVSRSKVDAQLKNGATVENRVLCLGQNDGYMDMTAKAGEVVRNLADFTVSARYRIDESAEIKGYGFFLWCFSCLEANQAKEGPYHAYRINEQRLETSMGGYTQETGIQKSKVSELGKWITVVYRQKAGHGELYIDGELIGTEEKFPEFKDIFSKAPTYNWIGRPPFNGDKYLSKTQVADFRVYNIAISDKEMKRLNKTK